MGELQINGEYFLLLHFHYFISLETDSTQKREVLLLRIYSSVNA